MSGPSDAKWKKKQCNCRDLLSAMLFGQVAVAESHQVQCREGECSTPLKLGCPEQRAVHSSAFVLLFGNPQIRKACGHDSPRRSARNQRILREVVRALMLSQEVFVENTASVDILRWSVEDGQNRIGEDRWLAEVRLIGLRILRCRRFDGLPSVS